MHNMSVIFVTAAVKDYNKQLHIFSSECVSSVKPLCQTNMGQYTSFS